MSNFDYEDGGDVDTGPSGPAVVPSAPRAAFTAVVLAEPVARRFKSDPHPDRIFHDDVSEHALEL